VTILYDDVVGQERAVAHLRAAAPAPVHAYLFVGPPGAGKGAAARSFAAALLCPDGGCGACAACRRARAGTHPDVVVVERVGPFITVEQADEIIRLAHRSPVEGTRKVLVLVDFHLVRETAPKLLKTIEEPPASTVFVVLAEDVPAELVTIASRCVRIDFAGLAPAQLADALVGEGVEPALAADVAEAAGGRLDRARLLASDPGFAERRAAWQAVPGRLDGTGAAAAVVARELLDLLDAAAVAPLEARHAEEVVALEERVERYGERGAGRKELLERHKRERKRLSDDELRFGLSTLEAHYRRALAAARDPAGCLEALDALHQAQAAVTRNPNKALLLQALLVRLTATRDRVPLA
jgi:DNA polymerase-3 subunit delta'